MPKQKIALCLEYPIHQQGGTEVIVRELIDGLSPQYSVALVSPDNAADLGRFGGMIAQHIRCDATRNKATAKQLADQLRKTGVSVAHFHSGGAFGWGARQVGASPLTHTARLGIRVFSTIHSVTNLLEGYCGPEKPLLFKGALFPFAWFGKMHVLSHVEREVAVSQHDLRRLTARYRPLGAKFHQIYHSRLSGQSNPAERSRETLILNVGHIAPRKGQATLVEAFGRIAQANPGWKLALVGHFAERSYELRIRDTIRSFGIEDRVMLAGPQLDTMSWMARASIYVQPSMEEALGLALQEAMYAGCACIGTRVGGIPELLVPGSGILVPRDNPEMLSQAMERLISSSADRENLGNTAARSVRSRGMTRDEMIAGYLSLYEAG